MDQTTGAGHPDSVRLVAQRSDISRRRLAAVCVTSPRNGGGYWTPLRVIIAVVGLALIAAYVLADIAESALPTTKPFPGAIAVFARVGPEVPGALEQDVVRVAISALTPGARGEQPRVGIDIAVCGSFPYKGLLVLTGAAIPTGAVITAPSSRVSHPKLEVFRADAKFVGGVPGDNAYLSDTARIEFEVAQPIACIARSDDADSFSGNVALSIVGNLRKPIAHSASVLSMTSPRTSQTWPTVGRLPWLAPAHRGIFTLDEVAGRWFIPPLRTAISAETLSDRVEVESSRPPLTSSTAVAWNSTVALSPIVRFVDLDSQNTWHRSLTALAVGLGVGASLLAALALEAASGRPSRRGAAAPLGTGNGGASTSVQSGDASAALSRVPAAKSPPQSSSVSLRLAGLLIVFGFVLGRRHRR